MTTCRVLNLSDFPGKTQICWEFSPVSIWDSYFVGWLVERDLPSQDTAFDGVLKVSFRILAPYFVGWFAERDLPCEIRHPMSLCRSLSAHQIRTMWGDFRKESCPCYGKRVALATERDLPLQDTAPDGFSKVSFCTLAPYFVGWFAERALFCEAQHPMGLCKVSFRQLALYLVGVWCGIWCGVWCGIRDKRKV